MTPLKVSIVAAVAAVILLLVIFELIRSRRLQERYALLWLLTGLVILVLALWRGALGWLAGLVGISYPPSALFVLASFFVLAAAAALLDGHLQALGAEHDAGAAPGAARAPGRPTISLLRRPARGRRLRARAPRDPT